MDFLIYELSKNTIEGVSECKCQIAIDSGSSIRESAIYLDLFSMSLCIYCDCAYTKKKIVYLTVPKHAIRSSFFVSYCSNCHEKTFYFTSVSI